MEPETGCEICFGIAYWEKRWVAVPFFHVPEDAINESGDLMRFKVTPLKGHIIESPPRRENRALETMVVSESIVPRLWSEKALKQLCKRNDLPLAWVTDRFPRKKCRTSGDANRREDRKIKSLTPKEFRSIRRELDKLNKQAALIINILWFLNQSLGKGGGFVTLAEVVRLKADDISPENNDGSNWIQLIRTRGDRTHMVVHCLPPRLWKSLCSQIDETSPFVFSSRDEGPFLPGQIDSYLKRAAEKAGIKGTITSLSLRSQFNKQRVKRMARKYHRDTSVKKYLEPVLSDEWDTICKRIPAILERKGRKSLHSPLELLNAILHQLKTLCPLRRLPSAFPPWRAVESQQRRWKKAGILDAILKFRQANNH